MPEAKNEADFEELERRLSEVFKPGTPISEKDLFRGRLPKIRDLVDTINQAGLHGILYGRC